MGGFRPVFSTTAVAMLVVAALGGGDALAGSGDDLPPNPVPGRCYEKVLTPPQYQDVPEQVLDRPGHTGSRVIPAVYRDEHRRELVCAERVETYTVEAAWRTVSETVVVRPASWRTVTYPAEYETVTERVLVREAHYDWRRGVLVDQRPTDPAHTRVTSTGEVLCYVLVPAEYRETTRQVLQRPARTERVLVPAETRQVTRQVIDRPARVERRVIPAEYRTVSVRVLVSPERVETYSVPPHYRTVMSRRLVSPGRYEWRVIRCEDGSEGVLPGYGAASAGYGGQGGQSGDIRVLTSPNLVRAVQSALAAQGYYRGAIDGLANGSTERGLARFQADRRLAPGWTKETLRALGVPYPYGAPD
jgi:hypothetical protein